MAEPTIRLRLRVSPGARRTELAGRYADGWKVRVTAAPERGRANEAVISLLARRLGLGSRTERSVVAGAAATRSPASASRRYRGRPSASTANENRNAADRAGPQGLPAGLAHGRTRADLLRGPLAGRAARALAQP